MEIRNEKPADYREVEELTRLAFWNVNKLGCDEHYLVHIMRNHPDFIPKLDFVLVENKKIIANVMFTKSNLMNEHGDIKNTITCGPLSVLPEYQRKGYGTALLNYAFAKALELGYDAVLLYGNPSNYINLGFRSCRHFHIHVLGGCCPASLLAKELKEKALTTKTGAVLIFHDSPVYNIDSAKAREFDKDFPVLMKKLKPSQELFYIYSHSEIF